ncbi:MAG: molybdenum cofactor biosynthesis protein MoaE [Actinobacteria bacterium]|nr:molybdenum cofactor biosynthesis protein MoaE [Actinomycetota bacterium]
MVCGHGGEPSGPGTAGRSAAAPLRRSTIGDVQPPAHGESWLGLTEAPLPVDDASAWVVRPDCGAVVLFSGTARDHADGRPDVSLLTYEAYESQVVPRLAAVDEELRRRWPAVGRVVLLHRTGELRVGESAVVVAVSAPHRDEAFAAARFGIDTVKATVPIWKQETWAGGESWGLEAQHIVEAEVG